MGRNILVYSLVGIISIWCTVYKLDVQPMYLWDESRQANNALEMMESGNYAYPTYENQPDFWNTKPHLLILLQSAAFHILGPGLLALRMPSALSGALVALIWFAFFYKRKQYYAAVIFLVILFCSRGFNTYHITRTGDYDALLLLFLSICITTWFEITEGGFTTKRSWIFGICFTLAVLTKSLAALLWLPVFAIVFLVMNSGKPLPWKRILLIIIAVFGFVGIYYLWRENVTPGYLQAVWDNEIAGRYARPNEGHVTEWYYYFTQLYYIYLEGFVFVLFLAILLCRNLQGIARRQFVFLLTTVVLFLAVISVSATRIHWYMAPAIPLLAAIVSLSTESWIRQKNWMRWLGVSAAIAILCIGSWQFNKLWESNLTDDGVLPQKLFQKVEREGKMPYSGIWLHTNYKPMENYYSRIYARKKIPFRMSGNFNFRTNDTLYLYQYSQMDSIAKYYYCRQFHAPDHQIPVWIFVVDSAKINAYR